MKRECHKQMSNNELKKMISNDLSEILSNRNGKNLFEILFVFHSFDIKRNHSFLENFQSKLDAKKSKNIRFATALCNHDNQRYYFDINRFEDNRSFTSKLFFNTLEIKSEILRLDWTSGSQRLVISLVKDSFVDNFFKIHQSSKSLEEIFLKEDDCVSKQIKYQNINFTKVNYQKSHADYSILDQILSEYFLMLKLTNICKENYLKELYFLKRNLYSSYEEYKKEKLYLTKSESINGFKNCLKLYSDCVTFKKERELENFKQETIRRICIQFSGDTLELIRNMFLTLAKSFNENNQSQKIWLEIFDNESTLMRILDIHLTAEYLVESFSKLKSSKLKISIAKINRLLFGSKYVTFICIDEDLSKAEIRNTQERLTMDAMECFTHFTYETTNRSLLCIDLRTLGIKNEIVITEPVIFSLIPERFGSSDLGISGIEKFKINHHCNQYCKAIGLKKI